MTPKMAPTREPKTAEKRGQMQERKSVKTIELFRRNRLLERSEASLEWFRAGVRNGSAQDPEDSYGFLNGYSSLLKIMQGRHFGLAAVAGFAAVAGRRTLGWGAQLPVTNSRLCLSQIS